MIFALATLIKWLVVLVLVQKDLRDSIHTNFRQGWLVNGERNGKNLISLPVKANKRSL